MQARAKATTAKTSTKKAAAKTAASDSPAKKTASSKKLAKDKETTASKAVKTKTRKTAPSAIELDIEKETPAKKAVTKTASSKIKNTRTKVVKPTEAEKTESAPKAKKKAVKTVAKVVSTTKTTETEAKPTTVNVRRSKKAVEATPAPEKKAQKTSLATKEATPEKATKAKTKVAAKTVASKGKTAVKAKVVAKAKASKAPASATAAPKTVSAKKAKKAEPVEKEVVIAESIEAENKTPSSDVAVDEPPKSSTQKAFEAAAEIAPLVQSHKSNGGNEVNAHEAQKAAEFLMNSMATKHDEHIVIDGITIPTQAELLEMPEEDYMNERQVAFFKWLLKQRESELKSNAGQTTENLRESTIAPDPADRATIEEEHALELRTRDRERKLLKKVQEALRRLEKGEFGWCEETGEPIGIPRLLARPTATLSLEAQQRREQRQKLYGD